MSSSSSDSEDEKLKLILEAADTNFLTDSLFTAKKDPEIVHPVDLPKSQRHLQNDNHNSIDFVPAESVQKIMSKKLALLVDEQIEFVSDVDLSVQIKNPKRRNRVRLLNDFDCYVNSYEDFEYEEVGPRKKPKIQRRAVDSDDLKEDDKLKSVVVNGDFILSGMDTENWSERTKGKVFRYTRVGGTTKHNLIEPETEFSKLRRKNKWNESKIKSTKFSTA